MKGGGDYVNYKNVSDILTLLKMLDLSSMNRWAEGMPLRKEVLVMSVKIKFLSSYAPLCWFI